MSHRLLIEQIHGIDFETNPPLPLLKFMRGHWRVLPLEEGKSLLSLEHNFEVKDNVSGLVEGITTPEEAFDFLMQGLYRNTLKELASIKELAEKTNEPKAE